MTKNPIINAASASMYIIFVALIMYFGTKNIPKGDTIFAPIVGVSLFTLSAAVMGYIFCYQPLLLILDGKKKDAVNLFIQTVGVFAAITAAILLLFFSGIIK